MNIKNYVQITENIHTSGQPTAEDFELIACMGIETVVNLAMPDSDGAIPDEGAIVTRLGMNYVHVPVVWQKPTQAQFELFVSIMQFHQKRKIWVHCALNWRVSAFFYLYKTKYLGSDPQSAREALLEMWELDEVWSQFIDDQSS